MATVSGYLLRREWSILSHSWVLDQCLDQRRVPSRHLPQTTKRGDNPRLETLMKTRQAGEKRTRSGTDDHRGRSHQVPESRLGKCVQPRTHGRSSAGKCNAGGRRASVGRHSSCSNVRRKSQVHDNNRFTRRFRDCARPAGRFYNNHRYGEVAGRATGRLFCLGRVARF